MIDKPTYEELEQRIKELEIAETGRKEVSEALRESQEKLRLLTAQTLLSIIILQDGRPVYANNAYSELTGYPIREIMGWKLEDTMRSIHPDYQDFVIEQGRKKMSGEVDGIVTNYQYKGVKKNGEEGWIDQYSQTILYNGKPADMICIVDITERKQAEKSLRESEEKYRKLTEFLPIALFKIDNQGNVIFANKSALQSTGFTQKDIDAGLNMLDLIAPQDHDKALRRSQQIMQGGLTDGSEYLVQRKDGTTYPGFINTRPSQHEASGLMGYIFDLTSLQEVEKALRESEEQLRFTASQIPGTIWTIDKDLQFTLSVGAALKSIGLEPGQAVGMSLHEFFGTDDPEYHSIKKHRQALEGHSVTYEDHWEGRDFETHLEPFRDSIGNVNGVIGISFDITERTKAEKNLRYFRQAVESSSDAIGMSTSEGKHYYQNEVFTRLFGLNVEEVEGEEGPPSTIYKDEKIGREVFETIMKGGEWNGEVEMLNKHRDKLIIHLRAYSIKDKDDQVLGLVGMHTDITDQKQAEKQLQRSAILLKTTQQLAKIGGWEIDLDKQTTFWTDEVYRIHDLQSDRFTSIENNKVDRAHNNQSDEFTHIDEAVKLSAECYDPEDRPVIIEAFRKCVEEGKAYDLEFPFTTTKGRRIWIRTITSPIMEGDRVIKVIGNFMDITDQKQTEEALRVSEERYRRLFNSIKDAIFVHQPGIDGKINKFIEVNDVACQKYGYTREELLELTPLDLAIPELKEDARMRVRNILSEKHYVFEIIHRSKQSKDIPVEVNAHLIDFYGQPTVLSIVRDISDRKRLESQLQQAQKMEAIGTLAGGIAHDFNNILTAILGNAELAEFEIPGNSPARHSLDQVYKAAYRARDLVAQILAFSRQTDQELKPIKVNIILQEALNLLRSSLPATIEIRQRITTKRDTIIGDPTQIHQIIMNLCTNAHHALRDEGGVLEVSLKDVDLDLETQTDYLDLKPGSYMQLSVKDTGPGMNRETVGRIFDPYFTTKEKGEGTGLGLSVVHGIVKNHGGSIIVNSEPGEGTTFHVYFPLVESHIEPESKEAEPVPEGNECILFVDDEEAICDIGKRSLQRLGYSVEVRTSSLEALEAFRSQPERYDLIITDMTMPQMTGDRLSKKLMEIRPDIPIVICTGFSEMLDERKAQEIGIRTFIMKPLVIRELANTVRKVLDEK